MPDRTCCGCDAPMTGSRAQTKWCSAACRMRAHRARAAQDRPRRARTPDRVCGACGGSFRTYNRRQQFCSRRCAQMGRPKPTRACDLCGADFVANSGRARFCPSCSPVWKDGRRHGFVRPFVIDCLCCGERVAASKEDAQFCSNRCWGAWQSRPVYGPPAPRHSTKLVHVGSLMRLPRPVQPVATGRIWVAGECRRCGDLFVIVDQTTATYCSSRCARADGRDRRRAAQRAAATGELVYRKRIFERDDWRCQLCKRKVRRDVDVMHDLAPTLDHILPIHEGGKHEPANVQCAHRICNSLKGARVHGVGEQLRLVG